MLYEVVGRLNGVKTTFTPKKASKLHCSYVLLPSLLHDSDVLPLSHATYTCLTILFCLNHMEFQHGNFAYTYSHFVPKKNRQIHRQATTGTGTCSGEGNLVLVTKSDGNQYQRLPNNDSRSAPVGTGAINITPKQTEPNNEQRTDPVVHGRLPTSVEHKNN